MSLQKRDERELSQKAVTYETQTPKQAFDRATDAMDARHTPRGTPQHASPKPSESSSTPMRYDIGRLSSLQSKIEHASAHLEEWSLNLQQAEHNEAAPNVLQQTTRQNTMDEVQAALEAVQELAFVATGGPSPRGGSGQTVLPLANYFSSPEQHHEQRKGTALMNGTTTPNQTPAKRYLGAMYAL